MRTRTTRLSKLLTPLGVALLLVGTATHSLAHGAGARGVHVLDWHTRHVARVVAPAQSMNFFGVFASGEAGVVISRRGQRCIRSTQIGIDVSDAYAFDIDEAVELRLEIDLAESDRHLLVAWDRSGGPGIESISLPTHGSALPSKTNGLYSLTLDLPRARFANRADHNTDILLVGQPNAMWLFEGQAQPLTICNIEVRRSFKTAVAPESGWLDLTLVDAAGQPAAARLGLYDASLRMPLPSADAIPIHKYTDATRTLLLRAETRWPVENRFAFYTDGRYRARLPAGSYRLVGRRGIEYRGIDQSLTITAGETLTLELELDRFTDQPARGWYSGDVHIHSARRSTRDGWNLLHQIEAEDLHVGNLLQMGNVSKTHFEQAGFGPDAGRLQNGMHAVVSGQEDPRTSHRGHTIHLNLRALIRFPERYLLYHEVFEAVAQQGGLSGYAHAGMPVLGTDVGLALEAPFGLVDFAEVMQFGRLNVESWFEFLNLGFRIPPAAGTDYPYLDHIGAVRSYVELRGAGHDPREKLVDAWFEGLAAGRTFVTNGPLLELDVGGAGMGDALNVQAGAMLVVTARASMSPEIDAFDRIELIEQGEVIATAHATGGAETVELHHRVRIDHGTWFALRAYGERAGPRNAIGAISGPVYVTVGDDPRTWKPEAVPATVQRLVQGLEHLAHATLEESPEQEWWETGPVWERTWKSQLAALEGRINEARKKLDALAAAAHSEADARMSPAGPAK